SAPSTHPPDILSVQEMKFQVPPAQPDVFQICWNPKPKAHLYPEEYIVQLGAVRYVPAAGLTEVRSKIQGRVDRALFELMVTTVTQGEKAEDTFVYLKPSYEGTCRETDSVPMDSRIELGFYQEHRDGRATLRFSLNAPAEEMALCWDMGSTKHNRSMLGKIPGAVNPKTLDPEVSWCGSTPDAPCLLRFYPKKISDQYPNLTEMPSEDGEGALVPSIYQDVLPFFQAHYSVYLVGNSCVDSLRILPSSEESRTPEAPIWKLSLVEAEADSVTAAIDVIDKIWLATHIRAHVCWRNEDSCTFEPAGDLKPCAAEVGVLLWT
ncbi:uncharacterized protein, partial [Physeter macrocephalus]|uniref:Uncharacterized protein n=1 Tax=Physeter macrocephalus TaxID=9755 RepID=A0A455B657_PHYMC